MKTFKYIDTNDTTLTIESNWGRNYEDAIKKYKEDNMDEIICIGLLDCSDGRQLIGLSIDKIKELREYLDNLINYFDNTTK